MPTFYSPGGNAEVWDTKPIGYTSEEELLGEYLEECGSVRYRATRLRIARDTLLRESDKYVLPDFPLSAEERESILLYRQALRDLPAQEGAPWDGGGGETPWPVMPTI